MTIHPLDNPETEAPDASASPGAALWPFLRAIRTHRRAVASILAVTLGASLLWLAQRSTEYSTSAELLVAPLSASDRSFVGLPLIRAVGPDASAGVGSAVSILDTRAAAELLAARLDDGTTPEAIDTAVTVERREDSSVVAVTARAPEPERAAILADGFARAALDVRGNALGRLAQTQIERAKDLLNDARDGGSSFIATEALRSRIADLRQIEDSGDPTLALVREATLPEAPEGAPLPVVLLVSLIAGLALGSATAILIEILGPLRITDEDALADTYPLPVLARLPSMSVAKGGMSSAELAAIRDAHRGLRSQLQFQVHGASNSDNGRTGTGRAIAFLGAPNGQGATFIASNLGHAVARSGESCSIVDPGTSGGGVSALLGAGGRRGEPLALPGPAGDGPFVRLPIGSSGRLDVLSPAAGHPERELTSRELESLIDGARSHAQWVIVDTAGPGVSAESIPLLKAVDGVVVVVKLGSTSVPDLMKVREIFELAQVVPEGYVVLDRDRGFLSGIHSSLVERLKRIRP